MLSIVIALLVNLLIETSVSFTVVVPGDPVVAHVGSTVILPCRISPPENAEALEIRWYRKDQFDKPVLHYKDGKVQDIQECFRNRTSLSPWSGQSGGLKVGDVSLRLEKLTFQDEGSFICEVSGENSYDDDVVHLKIKITELIVSEPSTLWKALFFTVLILALGLFGLILYKYRHKLTGKNLVKEDCENTMEKRTNKEACEEETMVKLTKEGDINIEELRKHAVEITIDSEHLHKGLILTNDYKMVRDDPGYVHTGEGFPYDLCAFGAQRFTSGRHYWEVDLAVRGSPPKNYWLIGVAKDGVLTSRDRSALTPSSGYWFLCSDGPNGFHINTETPVNLSLTPRPERLGVLLDYDEGQLSFYNVKESKHLLTISTRFSGSVVPLFNPGVGDHSMLRILDCPDPVESAEESSQPLLTNNSSNV